MSCRIRYNFPIGDNSDVETAAVNKRYKSHLIPWVGVSNDAYRVLSGKTCLAGRDEKLRKIMIFSFFLQ
jgi:hypothetical protein